MMACAEEQRPHATADDHHRHVHPADRAEVLAPIKAREHDARQANEAATSDTGAQYVSHHSAGLVQPQHAQGRGNASKVHQME